MSITIIVDGEINISAKKGIEINSGENIEINTNGKYTVIGQEGGVVYGNNPKNIPPMEVVKTIIKTRLKENYNGEFGFDWIEVNPFSREIEKIQGVDFSNVEYFYKAGNTPDNLGNILPVQGNEIAAKDAVANSYQLNRIGAYVDMPYLLMKKGQEIVLQTQTEIYEGELTNDILSITGDDYFEFELVGGTKTGKRSEIKLTSKKQKIDLKVTCLQEIGSQKTYEYKYKNDIFHVEIGVGGLTMMENTTLKLKFRVIALVSNENDPNSKAKALFKQFKDAGVKDYLNKNSLNQAGYEVEIENFDAMDSADVDEYFYAFDKADWTSKKLFGVIDTEKDKLNPDGTVVLKADGTPEKQKAEAIAYDSKDFNDPTKKANDLDNGTIEYYKTKLKTKGKSYDKGGFIILCDFISAKKNVGAYSRTTPLNHYLLFVYNSNLENKGSYAHEIGHMLGLEHLFIDVDERNSFNNSKNYYQTLKTNLANKTRDSSYFYTCSITYAKKRTLTESLNNFITNRRNYITEKQHNIVQGRAANGTFSYNGKPVTKNQYLALIQEDIDKQKKYIKENEEAIQKINLNGLEDFNEFKANFNLLKNDSIKIDKEYIKFYENQWKQIEMNYLSFKQASTKNIMDYKNTKVFYLAHQILIMRNDIKNYL